MHPLRRFGSLCVLAASVFAASASAGTTTLGPATITPIGTPTWEPQGIALFSAPIGTAASGYAEFQATSAAILPAPDHLLNPNFGIVPGAPHAGPYGQEIVNGVAAKGYKLGPNFTPADISNGQGVFLAWVFVPSIGAPTGSSPDFANGPIIPNSLFKIQQTGVTQRNGIDFDTAWTYSVDNVNNVLLTPHTPPYDGHSHFPEFEAESLDFGPAGTPAIGLYTEKFTLKDTAGNGWQIDTTYRVAAATGIPLPTAVWPALMVLVATATVHLLRKRGRATGTV